MDDKKVDVDRIKTGDILLFCRKDFIGKWIRSLTYCRWTHVAIAVRIQGDSVDDFKVVSSGGHLYVMEAIDDDWDDDFLSQTVKKDFRLCPIEYRMRKEYSLIAYRSLDSSSVHKSYLEKTKQFLLEHKDSKFYKSEFQLLKLWLTMNPNSSNIENKKPNEYCCTTIAAKYLHQVLGIQIEENLIPTSFTYYECDHHGLLLRDIYAPEVDFWISPEEWHESIGLMLAFLIVWVVFWWFSSSWVFKTG